MSWNGGVTNSTVNSNAEAHGPKEMDRVNKYHNDVDLEADPNDGSISTIRTKTRFRDGKLQFIDADGHILTFVVPNFANDQSITLPDDTGTIALSGGGGTPIDTIQNVGAGVGIFKQKVGSTADLYSLQALSNRIDIALNAGSNIIELDVDETQILINNLSGTLGISKGGTGQTTANAAFGALSPMTTNGDLITRASGVPTRIGIGSDGQVLTMVSGAPAWAAGGGGGGGNTTTLFKNTTTVTVVSTSTETNILNHTITGGTIGTNGVLHIVIAGWYLNNSGSDDSYEVRLRLGGTILWHDGSGTQSASSTRRPVYLELWIKNMNSASVQRITGEFLNGNAVAGDVGFSDISDDELRGVAPIQASGSIDTSSNQALVVSIDHADSDANISFNADLVFVELIAS